MSSKEPSFDDAVGLFQISEPGEGSAKSTRQAGRGIGIDLGTTHSLVSIAANGAQPTVLGEKQALLPSVVSYATERIEVGEAARAQALAFPSQVVSSVKRFMGRAPADIKFEHPYVMPSRDADGEPARVVRLDVGRATLVTPVETSASILKVLRERAEQELDGDVDGAVITVPAYFDDAQRQATKDAGRLAGIKVYRLLAEPTAAALAYGLDRGESGLFAVYDLGGGTFDISVLDLREGVFRVLATGGDSALGGDDFDRALMAYLFDVAKIDRASPQQVQEAMAESRRAKESLSTADFVMVSLPLSGLCDHRLERSTFEGMIATAVGRTIRCCKRALKDADVTVEDVAGVVLVGGSTRVPSVREAVEKTFGRRPFCDIDPDRVVAYGAAILADVLSGSAREGVTLLDVVPLSLGLETIGGIVEKIIPRNATIPISARQTFTNYSEKQTAMAINVVQGERELAKDCRSLAKFDLRDIPQLPPSMARIEVTFELDADALLTVTARELMTGSKQTIEVKPTYGLDEVEVDRLVMESLDRAREDYDARDLAEARVEFGRVALAVKTALVEVGEVDGMLVEGEAESITALIAEGDLAMANMNGTGPTLNALRERLEKASAAFAQRRMERALRAGMGGQTLAEIEGRLADDEELDRIRGSEHAEILER